MPEVFVSYKSEDRPKVLILVAALRRSGISVWWDQDIAPTADWEDAIQLALDSAKCIIVCWSSVACHPKTGRKVQVEAREALDNDKLVQVLIEKVSPPLFFRQAQAVDLSQWNGSTDHVNFQKLAQVVRDVVDGKAIIETFKRATKPLRFALPLIVALLVLLGLVGFIGSNPALSGKLRHFLVSGDKEPVIVGIYPSDAFGPLQKDGLHAALAPYAEKIRVIDLEAPYTDMRTGKAGSLLSKLRDILIQENVIAVVGPPVTEYSRPVLQEVQKSGVTTPVILTSASSRAFAGWDEIGIPVFRINSGIDERAFEFVDFAREAVNAGTPLVFFVESDSNQKNLTYGEVLFESIVNHIPEWQTWSEKGLVTRRIYQRGQLSEELARWNPEEFLARRQIIMLLGSGKDYATVAKTYYGKSAANRTSIIGGWMNAYDTDSAYRSSTFQWDRMFELTDFHFADSAKSETRRRFQDEFGYPSPALRDQAFSFDAGTLVAQTYMSTYVKDAKTGAELVKPFDPEEFSNKLQQSKINGITGLVIFGRNGQNIGTSNGHLLAYARFEGGHGWIVIDKKTDIIDKVLPFNTEETSLR